MKLLFIEDQPDNIQSVLNLIQREKPDIKPEISDFGEAEDKIASIRPDIVILDLLAGSSSEPVSEGLATRDFIWNNHFCPIVVYSARPDIHDKNHDAHPFVRSILKGKGSEQKVLAAVEEFRPHIDALREAEGHVMKSFAVAMREVAPYAYATYQDPQQRSEAIKRSGRRRLAALMDGLAIEGTKLASWEQYLFPPICDDVQLADILKEAEGERDDPTSFRVVLTPSCDLVASGDRTPKVDRVLVARCCPIDTALDQLSKLARKKVLGNKGKLHDYKDRLKKDLLTQGYNGGIIPLPGLKGRIPVMAADLRDLEFINLSNIGFSDKDFERIAAIDSPFRELVSWAYLQIACRPGLPDRDIDSWCDEIVDVLKK